MHHHCKDQCVPCTWINVMNIFQVIPAIYLEKTLRLIPRKTLRTFTNEFSLLFYFFFDSYNYISLFNGIRTLHKFTVDFHWMSFTIIVNLLTVNMLYAVNFNYFDPLVMLTFRTLLMYFDFDFFKKNSRVIWFSPIIVACWFVTLRLKKKTMNDI